jgi:hypothetical protein
MRLTQRFAPLSLDYYTLSGTPENTGTWTFMVTLSDHGFVAASKEFTLVINP